MKSERDWTMQYERWVYICAYVCVRSGFVYLCHLPSILLDNNNDTDVYLYSTQTPIQKL